MVDDTKHSGTAHSSGAGSPPNEAMIVADITKHSSTAHTVNSESTVNEEASSGSFAVSFIDYVPPPRPPVPPPAKYKLWILVLTLVFFAVWFSEQGNALNGLRFSGYLNFHAAQFLLLLIIVFCLTYSSLDLLVKGLTLKVGNKSYGIEPWLKQPRVQWVHKHDFFLVEVLAAIITSFEDGFEMLNPAPATDIEPPKADDSNESQVFDCQFKDCQVLLKIEHRVKPSKEEEYKAWQAKIRRRVMTQPGYISAVSHCGENGLVAIYLTFQSIDTLNDWMTSPQREKLVEEVKPMLQGDDVVQLIQTRKLPDAFTDLLTKQGQSVPQLLPKKWKVWWLTSCGLFFTLLIEEKVLPYYFEKWGLDDGHPRLQSFVASIFTTWFNSYIMTPFLIMIFFPWVRRKESEQTEKEPWRTLNDGIKSVWMKILLSLAFFGGCAISWALQ